EVLDPLRPCLRGQGEDLRALLRGEEQLGTVLEEGALRLGPERGIVVVLRVLRVLRPQRTGGEDEAERAESEGQGEGRSRGAEFHGGQLVARPVPRGKARGAPCWSGEPVGTARRQRLLWGTLCRRPSATHRSAPGKPATTFRASRCSPRKRCARTGTARA